MTLEFHERAKEFNESRPHPMSSDGTEYWLMLPKYITAVDNLLEQVRVMREGLKRYNDPNNWESTTHDSTLDGIGCTDFDSMKLTYGDVRQVGGRAARKALAEQERLTKELDSI